MVPSSGPSTKRGDVRCWTLAAGRDGAKALAPDRKAIASAKRVEATMVAKCRSNEGGDEREGGRRGTEKGGLK